METVARFNKFAIDGIDEDFGRGDDEYDTFFAGGEGPNKALTGVEQPPFYAARFVLSDLGTKGGLVTDADGRVLRPDGSPIDGLYASSNSAANMARRLLPGPRRAPRHRDGLRLARRTRHGIVTKRFCLTPGSFGIFRA